MRPSQTFHVLDALRNSSSATLRRKGVQLSADDSQTVLDVYQQWLALMIDLDYLHLSTLERTARRLWIDLIQADVLDLNNAFAECLHLIRMKDNRGFKALCKRISSHLYSLIKDDLDLVSLGNPFAAKRLMQLFAYTSRLSLNDIDLTQQQLQDYLKIEAAMPTEFDDDLVMRLNRIIMRWFSRFCPTDINPQHGPGGVAGHGRTTLEVKYKDLTFDSLTSYAFGKSYLHPSSIRSNLDRISETIFVPKSYKSFRTISMEPSTLQYLQQGVWGAIDYQVDHSPYLKARIGFHDQERNQLLAQKGSIERNFATIDLSAASDSVSYALVKKVFKGTWLLRYLVATRSHTTLLPDGTTCRLKKFAPMGSALCFPIETIIFASICELVTGRHRVAGQYSVFGDDIIVPTQCVEDVLSILTELGFYVNREKSFYQTDVWFRESCGAEYCDGVDVSPMRISRSYASHEQLVRNTKLIDLANRAYLRGFKHLRVFFIRKLQTSGYIPLFSSRELLSDNYTNYHTTSRWNKNLQRLEFKVTTLVSKQKPEDLAHQDEIVRYRHWLESRAPRNRKLGLSPAIRYRNHWKREQDLSKVKDSFQSIICRSTVFTKVSWRNEPSAGLDQAHEDLLRQVNPSSEILLAPYAPEDIPERFQRRG